MDFEPLLQRPAMPGILQVARYFQALAPGETLPKRADFRPAQLRSVIGFIFLVDILPDDYRWELIGEHIGVLFGIDGTGVMLSEVLPADQSHRLRQTYDAVVQSRSYLYVRGRYAWADRSVAIERLLVPLADREGRLTTIFGLTLPDAPTDLLRVFTGIGAATLEIDETISGV